MNSFEMQQLERELKTTPEQRMQWLTKAFRLARAGNWAKGAKGTLLKRLNSMENSVSKGRNGASYHLER